MTLKYYDSCIFGNSLNPAHPDHEGCCLVTSVNNIEWSVGFCEELVCAELPSCVEFLASFFSYCTSSGIKVVTSELSRGKEVAKKYRAQKKALEVLGFRGNDWNHLMIAVGCDAEEILTTDEDFFDPANKAVSAKKPKKRVQSYIEKEFDILVVRPA